MPFTLLAHQAPVLPLKRIWPRWFDGVALCLGSMAPDLEYLLLHTRRPIDGHSLVGQFTFCLPLTLVMTLLFRRFLVGPLAAHLPALGPLRLRDYRYLAGWPASVLDWLKLVTSALVGSFSHVWLDAFTHGNGWFVLRLPLLRRVAFPVRGVPWKWYRVLQYGGSVVLAVVAVLLLVSIARAGILRRAAPSASPRTPAFARLRPTPTSHAVLWSCAALPTIFSAWALLRYGTVATLFFWGFLCFELAGVAGMGLLLGSILAVPHMREAE